MLQNGVVALCGSSCACLESMQAGRSAASSRKRALCTCAIMPSPPLLRVTRPEDANATCHAFAVPQLRPQTESPFTTRHTTRVTHLQSCARRAQHGQPHARRTPSTRSPDHSFAWRHPARCGPGPTPTRCWLQLRPLSLPDVVQRAARNPAVPPSPLRCLRALLVMRLRFAHWRSRAGWRTAAPAAAGAAAAQARPPRPADLRTWLPARAMLVLLRADGPSGKACDQQPETTELVLAA